MNHIKSRLRDFYFRDGIELLPSPITDLRNPPKFPKALHIEVTNKCDNKCIFCTRDKMTRDERNIHPSLFKKIIDESAEHDVNLINLFKDGDPVLNLQLPEFIKYAKDKKAGKEITISTSANALTPELSEKIILAGLDKIFFSVDALTEDKYRKLKGTENYGKTLKNIFDFVKIREKLNSKSPQIIVKMIALDTNKEDVEMFVKMWINIADIVAIDNEINVWDGSHDDVKNLISNMDNYRAKCEERYPCNRPWYMLSIYSDGKVTVCPEDWNQKMVLGDVYYQSLYEIFNGEKLKEVKRCHLDKEWDKLDACKNCDAHTLKNIGNWFRENREIALR